MTLLYDVAREEEKMIIKTAERLGVSLKVQKLGDAIDLNQWMPGVYLVRTLSHNKGIVTAAAVEGSGGVAINTSSAISICWNKAVALTRLRAAGLPTPRTYVLFGSADVEFEGRAIVKTVSGSWGRKVALVTNREELESVLKSSEGEVFMLQERVGTGEDIRVFVINGRAVAAMRRIPPVGDWRSNAARGGVTIPQRIDGELEELAVKAAEAVGAFYAGVDILIGDGLYLNEVNGIPEFKALAKTTGVDVAEALLREIVTVEKR